jgi:hypothetical protein
MCLAIHTTSISQFAATFNDARNREPSCWSPAFCGRPVQELLPVRHLASAASHGLLHAQHPPPSAAGRFDSAFNALRLASATDCSALNALRPCWSRITPCHGLLRVQHLKLRPVCGLLRIRHLALMRRSWIAPRSPPSAPHRPRIAPRATLGFSCRSTDCSVR